MPLFDYKCADCAARYEVLVRGGEKDEMRCPQCGSVRQKRLVSAASVAVGGSTVGGSSYDSSASSCDTGGCCGGYCGTN